MTKQNNVQIIKTVLFRPLFLIFLIFALILVPAVAFADGDSSSDSSSSSSSSSSSGSGSTTSSGSSGSGSSFSSSSSNPGPAVDSGNLSSSGADSTAGFDGNTAFDSGSSKTDSSPDFSFSSNDTPSSDSPALKSATGVNENPAYETPAYEPSAPESSNDNPEPTLATTSSNDDVPSTDQTDQTLSLDQPDVSPADLSGNNAESTTVSDAEPALAPQYYQVAEESMNPLFKPGDMVEVTSPDYADGDPVIARLADGTYVVKMLDGDQLVSLSSDISYPLSEATILGAANLSLLTAADLEADGLSFGSVLAQTAVQPVGAGGSTDPYLIETLANLYWISQNGTSWDKHFSQTADIDASATSTWAGGAGWEPIGTEANPFTGTYNGDGYTISGLFINRPDTGYIGLFGFTGPGATLSNIGLVNVNVTSTYVEGSTGGLVGWNEGTITNSYVTGSINGINFVGGLVGDNTGTITNSYTSGNVIGSDGSHVGGLVGSNSGPGTITNSYASGNVTGNQQVGGLVGSNSGPGTITNSYASGNVTGNQQVGGLVGWHMAGMITNSYASGNVTGSGDNVANVGGLVGLNQGTVTNSYAAGSVTGLGGTIGGLVGRNDSTVTNSYWNFNNFAGHGIGPDSMNTAGATGKTTAEMLTLAFHQITLGWGETITTTTATVERGGYNPYPFPRLFWELGIGNSPIWYIYVSDDNGNGDKGPSFSNGLFGRFFKPLSGGGFGSFSGGSPSGGFKPPSVGPFNFDFGFASPQLTTPGASLTILTSQVGAWIAPVSIAYGSLNDLNGATLAYWEAHAYLESNRASLSPAEIALLEVELAIAQAALLAMEARLLAADGLPFNLAEIEAAYAEAEAALNANLSLLNTDQQAAANALLSAIAALIAALQ